MQSVRRSGGGGGGAGVEDDLGDVLGCGHGDWAVRLRCNEDLGRAMIEGDSVLVTYRNTLECAENESLPVTLT
jgi:hypothetical protein